MNVLLQELVQNYLRKVKMKVKAKPKSEGCEADKIHLRGEKDRTDIC